MSHLIEEYAKNLGVKITKPMIAKHFYPILADKYITIHSEHLIESKKYNYFNLVVDLLKKTLNDRGIKIVQIGAKQNSVIESVDSCFGDLSFKQSAYIISNSLAHVGVDNVFSHYASSINIPLISIFGNVYPATSEGFWSPKNKKINIEAPWEVKPCLNLIDPEDAINKIKPEIIAQSILDQLNLNIKINIKTKYIGKFFNSKIIEIVPNFFEPYQELKDKLVFIRIDYGFDFDSFINWCNWCDVSIITDKIIPPDIIESHSAKIKNISFIIDENMNLEESYIEYIKSKKINFKILVKQNNLIADIKEKYFDTQVAEYSALKKEEIKDEFLNIENVLFNSGKTIFSNGKKYPSKYHWQVDKNIIDKNLNIEDNETFYEELNHYYIYERTK